MNTLTMLTALTALTAPFAAFASGPGVPNPADALCEKTGGKLEILVTEAGESGYCVFGERAIIGTWTLFRELKGGKTEAVAAFLRGPQPDRPHGRGIGLPNPASVNCVQAGGKVQIAKASGGEIGICEFSDRSEIEEWTLFRGPAAEENAELTRILR